MIDVPEHPTAEQLAELRKTAVVNLRAAIQDMVPTDFGPHRVEREEAFCLDAINAIGDYTEARRRWAEDHPVDAGQHFRRMGADGRLLPDERRPPAHQKSARELYEREIAKITGDDPWAVKMRAQTRRYYHIDETHIDDLADDPADEGQP
jgi:hypothetical protein